MPTGYTADVQSGKITEFKDFVLQCARAFGALITMRDDPMDKPIPDEFKPDSYIKTRLDETKDALAGLDAMTEDEIVQASKQHNADELQRFKERMQEKTDQRRRYEAMLSKVVEWTPPTGDHAELRTFMISQLQESIKFDCSYEPETPNPMTPTEWLNHKRTDLQRDVEYYTKSHEEEIERAAKRTEWVKALKKSLETV
jgi:hypothetical protein